MTTTRTEIDTAAHAQPNHSNSLSGLRVAVTGGTSGLGLALVRQFIDAGASVAFVARNERDVDRISNETGAIGIVGDVGHKGDIHPIALQINANLGGLDVLVNNASTLGPVPLARLADTDCEDFEAALQVNVLGAFRLTKALLGSLATSARHGPHAVVINITSDAAVNAYPDWGAYGASKAALQHMTNIWGEESSGLGIRFAAIDPGDMNTPLHALADPSADPATLKDPADAATEVIAAIAAARSVEPTTATIGVAS